MTSGTNCGKTVEKGSDPLNRPRSLSVIRAMAAQLFDRLRQDVSYGLRLFRRGPGLNLSVVVALALGIGATSATFSVVDAVLLRPLDYADADQLVVVMHRRTNPVSPANYLDWQRNSTQTFSSMGAAEYWTPTLGSAAEPEKLFALHV